MGISAIIAVLLVIFFPWFAMTLEKKVSFFKKIGAIVTCYIFGALLGNIGWTHGGEPIIKEIVDITIPIAIPLFIYSTDFLGWVRHSKSAVISFLLCILSVVIVTVIAGIFFQDTLPDAWQVSGMLAGVYTGGTPNLTAIGQSLSVASETIVIVNSLDMIAGSVILFVLLYFGRSFLSNFLHVLPLRPEDKIEEIKFDEVNRSKLIKGGFIGLGLSILSLGASFGLCFLIFNKLNIAFLIFMITTFGILFSFNTKIRTLKGPFEFGHYLLMIFCVGIGSMANVSELMNKTGPVMAMVLIVVFSAVILHLILAKIFKIDRDTAVITSVAGIFGPPFVPLIADRFENKSMIVPGMTTGLIGFAVGNYLGMAIAFFLKSLI